MLDTKKILMVEKDEDMRAQLYQEIKEITQFQIVQASDGVQAYQKARNQKFDVVMTNFHLAKMSGSQLISAVRETNHNIHTPILIYTDDKETAKIETRGMKHVEYLDKPAEYQVIADKLKALADIDPNKKIFKLDVDFINPFIDSSMKTLNGLCGVESIKPMKPYMLTEEEEMDIDISGTLAITSPYFRGSIAISFSDKVYKDIVSKMLEENQDDIDIDNQDGAAEIINIIFGQTKAVLNTRGYSLERAIPSVVRGQNHKIYQNSKIPVLLVPFNSDVGRFYIQICVKAI